MLLSGGTRRSVVNLTPLNIVIPLQDESLR